MHDIFYCPICFHQLKSTKAQLFKNIKTNKTAHYIQRTCFYNPHSLSFYTDKSTGKIDWIRFSPTLDYSTFVEIDFVNDESMIILYEDSREKLKLKLNEAIIPDFPILSKLKEKIELLFVFQ